MSIDLFFEKRYNKNLYNCAHFAVDVWRHLTGDDIAHIMTGFLLPAKDRSVKMDLRHNFVKLSAPETPCIVLMQRKGKTPHVGIFINDRVFHLTERGAEFQPLDLVSIPFNRIGFYKC